MMLHGLLTMQGSRPLGLQDIDYHNLTTGDLTTLGIKTFGQIRSLGTLRVGCALGGGESKENKAD